MKLIFIFFISALYLFSELCEARISKLGLSETPPRGWNSYDSFSWIVSEQEFLDNAKIVAEKLHTFGYEYVVVDFLWYRKNAEGANLDAIGFDNIDEWGRVIPDPDRWPSSKGGVGFKEVARQVHELGLKFGIHAMRGINAQAVNANTHILDVFKGGAYSESGHEWHAQEIGIRDMTCGWMKGFMSVNTDLGAGKAFLRSLYRQYAEWGVDFVKVDCVFGDDLDSKEIITVSELLQEIDRPILLSVSPGTRATPSLVEGLNEHIDMYRVTGDDWDTWEDVAFHFDVARDFAAAKKIGAQGLHGRSWPDLDMLPLGWLTDPGVQQGPHRSCRLTLDEQRTQVTLWSMARSPLMFGGDLRSIDEATYSLITNSIILEINSYSTNNMEYPHIYASEDRIKNYALSQRFTNPYHIHTLDREELQLVSCSNQNSRTWFTASEGVMDRICWNDGMEISENISNCLYKKTPIMTWNEEDITDGVKYRGKFHLTAAGTVDRCLDASVNRKLTASERRRISLSTCNWNASQIWELKDDRTLKSSYSNLCAIVGPIKENVDTNGIRAWIANGRKGEIYLAFFNLNAQRTQITSRIGDLARFKSKSVKTVGSCKCLEVWSGKNFGVVNETLSVAVEAHGCALFVLNCNI